MFCAHVAEIIPCLSVSSTGGHFNTTEDSDEGTVENENVDEEKERNDLLWIIPLSVVVLLLLMALVASYSAFQ